MNDCLATLTSNRFTAIAVSRKHVSNSVSISKDKIFCFERSQNIRSIDISLLVRHDFNILAELDRLIRYSVEAGLFLKWERDSNSPDSNGKSDSIRYNQITWEHFVGGVLMLCIGYMFGMIAFFLELFVKHMRRAHRRNKFWIVVERLIDGHRYELL